VDADGIVFRRALVTRHTAGSELVLPADVTVLPTVPIVADYAGSEALALQGYVAAGAQGLVVQAFGGGRASPETRRALTEAAEAGVPVVLASRVPEGRVMGSVADPERGVLAAGDLPPHRARVLLMLALAQGRGPGEIQRLLDTHQ